MFDHLPGWTCPRAGANLLMHAEKTEELPAPGKSQCTDGSAVNKVYIVINTSTATNDWLRGLGLCHLRAGRQPLDHRQWTKAMTERERKERGQRKNAEGFTFQGKPISWQERGPSLLEHLCWLGDPRQLQLLMDFLETPEGTSVGKGARLSGCNVCWSSHIHLGSLCPPWGQRLPCVRTAPSLHGSN